ncbi:hypothetical protein J3D55_001412 [Chryseobacterium ginsenosidimutans]|nr:hypothetical protein [Chryseobacterium ginsenosidimutans]
MKKILNFLTLFVFFLGFGQIDNIADGESITLRIHYGFFNAGTANLTAQKTTYKGAPHLHVRGTGQTTGAVKAFFKVEDFYESYINMQTETSQFLCKKCEGRKLSTTF